MAQNNKEGYENLKVLIDNHEKTNTSVNTNIAAMNFKFNAHILECSTTIKKHDLDLKDFKDRLDDVVNHMNLTS